jgi:protein-disulfide isomerase
VIGWPGDSLGKGQEAQVTRRGWPIGVVPGLLALALALPAGAQEPTQADDLKKEIQSLREMLEDIQKDISEIKSSLARRGQQRPSPVGQVIDLAGGVVRGEQTAPLTLVEFSDYQ